MIHQHPHKTFIWPRRKLDDEVSAKDQAMGKDSPCCILESWQKFFVFFCWLKLWSCVDISSIPANIELFFCCHARSSAKLIVWSENCRNFRWVWGPKSALGSFPAKHGWFWRHFGSDLYLPRCHNCQGALVKGERLWPGNGSLWDRSQLSLRSSKHKKGEDVEGPGLVIGGKYIHHSIVISTVRARPPRVATMHHRCGCRRVFWWGWKTVFVYQKRTSKGCWFLSLLNTVKGPDFDRRSWLLNFCFYWGRLP